MVDVVFLVVLDDEGQMEAGRSQAQTGVTPYSAGLIVRFGAPLRFPPSFRIGQVIGLPQF